MNESLSRIATLAGHEYRAAVRSRLLIGLAVVLVGVTAASVYIASVDYRSQLADYQAYLDAAAAGGLTTAAPSPLRLLSLLRGAMEYLEIVGAVVAIALGYLSVARERASRTLPLVRSRPVSPGEQAVGNVVGALGVLGSLIAVTAIAAVVCLGVIGNDWPDFSQSIKLLLAYVAALIYLGIFYCLGVVVSTRSRVAANGLMIALGIWLVVVLVLPQIGDTLDADNQIPGGLFAALGLDRAGETTILSQFRIYEQIRTGTEELSLAKHFERFAFAMTEVAPKYDGFSLPSLLHAKRDDIAWLVVGATALFAGVWHSFRRQPAISAGGNP